MADWELNYSDRETLRPALVSRLTEAVRKYLLYVQGGGGSPSNTRKQWCTENLGNVSSIAQQLSHYCMSEPTFIAGGTSITDTTLQARVEFVLQTYFMPA
jgi:hypothetical protein